MTNNEANALLDLYEAKDKYNNSIYQIHGNGAFTDEIVYLGRSNDKSGFTISFYNPSIDRSRNLLDHKLSDFKVSKRININEVQLLSKKSLSITPVSTKLVKGKKYRLKTIDELLEIYSQDSDNNIIDSNGKIILPKRLFWKCKSLLTYGVDKLKDYDTHEHYLQGGKDNLIEYKVLPEMVWNIDKDYII